jgi:hypothetical protein
MIGTLRRDILDHVIVLSEEHLRRLLKGYLCYYHDDRTHLSLNKDRARSEIGEAQGIPGLAEDSPETSNGSHREPLLVSGRKLTAW